MLLSGQAVPYKGIPICGYCKISLLGKVFRRFLEQLLKSIYFADQPTTRDCLLKSLVPASVEAVLRLSKFVNVVQRSDDDEPTNHEAAMNAVAEMAGNTRGLEGSVQGSVVQQSHLSSMVVLQYAAVCCSMLQYAAGAE